MTTSESAQAGVVAVAEPAFWAGFDRRYAGTFIDYFRQISEFEPTRAAKISGIRHFCWVAVNPKESENISLSREVMAAVSGFLDKPTVLGIGEIGLNKNTRERTGHLPGTDGNGHQASATGAHPHSAPSR